MTKTIDGSFINQGDYVSGLSNILTEKRAKDMSNTSHIFSYF